MADGLQGVRGSSLPYPEHRFSLASLILKRHLGLTPFGASSAVLVSWQKSISAHLPGLHFVKNVGSYPAWAHLCDRKYASLGAAVLFRGISGFVRCGKKRLSCLRRIQVVQAHPGEWQKNDPE